MESLLFLVIASCLAGNVAAFTSFGDGKKHNSREEIVLEHDITIDEYTLMPFLKTLLKRAGFTRQRTFSDVIRNSVLDRRQANESQYAFSRRYNFLYQMASTKAVFESVSHCQKLKKSIRRLKPILSVLIRGGKRQAKLLAKKFSTKLPVKRCRAILTIYCEPPQLPKVRAPRAKRY